MKLDITLQVNGQDEQATIEPNWTLLKVLREPLGLTGTKEGCATGACGACTVLVDGLPIYSCLSLAITHEGRQITTIEGLSRGGQPSPVQRAFVEQGGIQCGFCTPGMIVAATAFLAENPGPSEQEIREGISGNFCRCTGYVKIVKAIQVAAREMAGAAAS